MLTGTMLVSKMQTHKKSIKAALHNSLSLTIIDMHVALIIIIIYN